MTDELPFEPKEIKAFLDEEGRVKAMPSKRRKQLIVLHYIAGRIPLKAEESCTESDMNGLLNRLITYGDPATLRRDLVDLCLLNRTKDGTKYWLPEDPPALEKLLSSCL